MVYKRLAKYSIPLPVREKKNKTALKFCLISVKRKVTQTTNNDEFW